ncbi:MAG TPA: histidine phosphatase family protein [Terriglobales bacterium]|nr:histidine phosphatase family protein [Terriglobales bacterium]
MPSETTLLLVRHAHSTLAGRFCGHTDAALSELGEKQLPQIVDDLKRWPITKVYSSDLKRAYDTAAAIAAHRALPFVSRAGLREISFGEWEGLVWAEIEAKAPAEAGPWLSEYPIRAAPGGESFAQFRLRVEAELQALVQESEQQCVAVVTHAGFIRVALAGILGMDERSAHKIEIHYGGVTVLQYAQQSWRVEGVNICR